MPPETLRDVTLPIGYRLRVVRTEAGLLLVTLSWPDDEHLLTGYPTWNPPVWDDAELGRALQGMTRIYADEQGHIMSPPDIELPPLTFAQHYWLTGGEAEYFYTTGSYLRRPRCPSCGTEPAKIRRSNRCNQCGTIWRPAKVRNVRHSSAPPAPLAPGDADPDESTLIELGPAPRPPYEPG